MPMFCILFGLRRQADRHASNPTACIELYLCHTATVSAMLNISTAKRNVAEAMHGNAAA